MSTIHNFNDEISTVETTVAEADIFLMHDASAAVKKQVPLSTLRKAVLGNTSTGPVGFFGGTQQIRYANSIAQPASTASVSISATQWGFTSSTQGDAIITAVHRMASAFAYYGLATSA